MRAGEHTVNHPHEVNPYLEARARWNEVYGSYIDAARNWRLAAMLAFIAAAISSVGLAYVASQSRVIPYVVKVNKLGDAVAVGPAEDIRTPDARVIGAQLARWITAVRSVYVDATAQRTLINEAYAMINRNGAALTAINDYMRAHDPFKRASSETVSVEVQSVLPITENSWRVEWHESSRGRDGKRRGSWQYQATMTISIDPPSDESTIRLNPMGVYIESFSWAKRL